MQDYTLIIVPMTKNDTTAQAEIIIVAVVCVVVSWPWPLPSSPTFLLSPASSRSRPHAAQCFFENRISCIRSQEPHPRKRVQSYVWRLCSDVTHVRGCC